jgi:Helix-turn-helix domain
MEATIERKGTRPPISIPYNIFAFPRLTPGARLLYALIFSYVEKGMSVPAQSKLAQILSVGKRSIHKYAAELEYAQLISIHRTTGRKANIYELKSSAPRV